jgi:hypothetical protein
MQSDADNAGLAQTKTDSPGDVKPDGATAHAQEATDYVNRIPLKAGYKTTEFWITVLVIVIAALEAVTGILPAEKATTISGILVVIYKVVRLALKWQRPLGLPLDPLRDIFPDGNHEDAKSTKG